MSRSIVHIVHCVDTEGPLHESVEATFDRLRELFSIDLKPSVETLGKLQNQEIDLGGIEEEVARVVDPKLLNYNDTWEKIDAMLAHITSPEFRNAMPDSFGGGWKYNWHCLDHVGHRANPRRRDLGFHKIFDRFQKLIATNTGSGDAIHFHHHPVAFSRQANHSATHFFHPTSEILESLARRIIDRNWFASTFRPGFHAERPDSHWFLEQFIPFDYGNQAPSGDLDDQADVATGRFGDWRRAPNKWSPYHPSQDDYQTEGDCRRWITRCLNIGTRHSLLQESDVRQAFSEARPGQPSILAFTNHDHRDMAPDVMHVRAMISRVADEYPQVSFRYSEARDAMRRTLHLPDLPPLDLDMSWSNNRLDIKASDRTFGPQPFLALKTRDGRYLHDNLDFEMPFHSWSYVFDDMTVPLEAIDKVGLGTCDSIGNITTKVLDPATGAIVTTHH